MGASAWDYFTPYKQNLQEAFETLRESVFESGDYYRLGADLPDTFEEFIIQYNLNIDSNQFESRKSDYIILKDQSRIVPQSIEHLMKLNQECGTHSILDISEISTSTDLDDDSGGLPENELIKLFGTLKPTRQMIESKEDLLRHYRGRWMCTYVVAYENDQPTEIYFTGYSGD